MDKQLQLDILILLSQLESTIDMKQFRNEVPDWLSERLSDLSEKLAEQILEGK